MQTTSIVIGIIVLILGVGYLATNQDYRAVDEVVTAESDSTEAATDRTSGNETVGDIHETDTVGTYQEYDATAIAESEAEHILLFFHATWCPSCRALDADIVANADNIPPGVEIYKVDFDTATELKRQYGVTTQHSVLEISPTGEAESAISHGLTLSDVLATI